VAAGLCGSVDDGVCTSYVATRAMKETRNFYAVHCRSHPKLSRWKQLTIMTESSAASSRERLEAQNSISGLRLHCTNCRPLDDSSTTLRFVQLPISRITGQVENGPFIL